jgi:hypothetical protein
MGVYVDSAIWWWSGCRWCHLLGDDLDELHRFAALLGIKRTSFQCAPKTATPHYDLTAFERARAIRLGAVVCSREEIVAVSRRARANFKLPPTIGVPLPPRGSPTASSERHRGH